MKPEFTGSALSIEEQIALLERQGLTIGDRDKAIRILSNVSYSRLKSYLIPLMADRATHRFREGATFDDAYTLYGFDRRLRELIFHEMEKVEISLRTRIAYAYSGAEKGYWYANPDWFRDPKEHKDIIRKITADFERSDNESLKRFREKYSNPLPPCWMALEASSMGTLAIIYDAMSYSPLKKGIADWYSLSTEDLSSWMFHLVWIRNQCAHHNRLWNRTLEQRPNVPLRAKKHFPPQNEKSASHIYITLCVIKYLQDTVKPGNTFAERLKTLLDNYPRIDPTLMGFPQDWREDPLWNSKTDNGED